MADQEIRAERRPTGDATIMASWLLLIVATMLLLIGIILPETSQPYSFEPAEPNIWKWRIIWLGAALFSIGVLLWSVGTIVRAISFLPGKADAEK